ncbi:MAG: hypothetical protein HKL87_05170 [Acidimicrobiaceae bacterium]|nr:hypothetical protein [Acidimicrobiaceae bacterium]
MSEQKGRGSSARRRFVPATVVSGLAVAALSLTTLSGSSAGFAASITNSNNTAASGVLVMQETNSAGTTTCTSTDGGTVSTNSSTCTTINKFGGSTTMVPGQSVVTTVNIKNIGTVPANTFTLTPGSICTQSNNGALNGTATDFCAKLDIVVTSGATTVFNGTAATLAGATPIALSAPVAPGTSVPFTFTTTLSSTAGNTYQGLAASLPLTWTFNS